MGHEAVAQDRDQLRGFVKAVMIFRIKKRRVISWLTERILVFEE
jgi:hypothetical protein